MSGIVRRIGQGGFLRVFGRFFSELKERNVIRVAGIYAVTAWGLFQIVKTVFDTMGAPAWAAQVALVLLAAGLPIAAIVAWAFERGPDGGVRLAEAPDAAAPRARVGWIDGLLLGGVALVVLASVLQLTGVISLPGMGGKPAAPAVSAKSVAVLPFANFSNRPESEFFADGLTEEVINSLAQSPELKVVGRTSAFYFKDKNEDLREVGRKLGVSHVVEGSVRTEGERLRVTAQLIKVSDGFHVWSKTYDRTGEDALTIQTEIASAVAEALKTSLAVGDAATPAERSPEAYRLELVAKAQARRLGLAELTNARQMYQQLIELEPNNPDHYAGLAITTAFLAQNYLTIPFAEAEREAQGAVNKAIALNPNASSGWLAKGVLCTILTIRASRQSCEAEGRQAYEMALKLNPKDPDALVFYANHMGSRSAKETLPIVRRALEIDPLNRVAQVVYAGALQATGDLRGAERQYLATIELFPDFVDAKQELADLYLREGRLDLAEVWLRAAATPASDPSAAIQLAHIYYNLGLNADADAVLSGIKDPPVAADVGRAIRLLRAEDWAGVERFARERLDASGDPLWRAGLATAQMMLGRAEPTRALLLEISPELFAPDPSVTSGGLEEAVRAAWVCQQLGDLGQARRILDKVLQVTAPQPGVLQTPVRRAARVRAYEMLGQRDQALAELSGAVDEGFRTPIDLDSFIRLDRYPMMAAMAKDPRFQAQMRRIEADNARMRAAVIERRNPGARRNVTTATALAPPRA
ncbi:MAG TPA: hypothetical protein VEA79_04330 [Phenylobacterium sp.]|nr:hypothetical protein [Phenylobacterium sp.]